ncbi:uncharacterized protein LOC131689859 isoform X4 [Topomyia yanbarensis]|uniref:uncharacterized protein LOC131689859 isoform X4 n=1 Tax=Topomyia yanbarensis TaxID=2498891 RepID=UPI00273AEC4D|nr:uncharacterized protein LOC131689859 isoform X4 [Topomyia yanbarensis]XP_058831187.1 uncharacterized protein LOC131689859 isoform X4 [Topomyia yanbarensis]
MCSHKTYKVLCYLVAAINIGLVFKIMFDDFIPTTKKVAEMILPPCIANIILAVLLIFGVAERRLSFIKVFQTFVYLQMAGMLVITLYIHKLVQEGYEELRGMEYVPMTFFALFALESLIANGGYKAVLYEPRTLPEETVMFQTPA